MSFPGYIRGLRLGSDGPALYGINAGDVPVWNPTTGWEVGPGGGQGNGCLRSTAVLSAGDTVATFTMDLAALLTGIGVPGTGHVLVSSRVALVAMHETNGNTPTPLTQIYPVILDVLDGAITSASWNATFETAQVPPGYLAVPGTLVGDNALITAITPTGTSIDLVWTASPDFFNSDFLPGAQFCVQAITGVGA